MAFVLGATINPVPGSSVLSRQGQRATRSSWHNGIDLSGTVGTPVYATAAGVVDKVNTDCLSEAQIAALSARERRTRSGGPCGCGSTYGNFVLIKHGDSYYSLYAHLDTVLVSVGQSVTTTTQIGTVGATTALPNDRCLSMAPHLHFEVVKSWPLSSRDTASRYDVLHELAAAGVVMQGDILTVTGVASAYNEPALQVAKTTGTTFDPTAGAGQRSGSKWPLYVGIGAAGLAFLGIVYWAVRRRKTALSGVQGRITPERLLIEGFDKAGKPYQQYADKLAAMSEEAFMKACERAIRASAASIDPDQIWQADVCHAEAQRRGKPQLYTTAFKRVPGISDLAGGWGEFTALPPDPPDRVVIEGKDNYGKPRQRYADRLAKMSEKEYLEACEKAIWLSAFAANNPRSDYHWHTDICYAEANRRGNVGLYVRAFNAAKRSVGGQ